MRYCGTCNRHPALALHVESSTQNPGMGFCHGREAMRGFCIAVVAAAAATLGVSQGAFAADSRPPLVKAAAPATGWTGFYAGLTLGYGWEDRTITATGNDPISTGVLTGTIGQPGDQPVGPVSFRDKGAFGGIEAGYNWQIGRNYVAGIEADFNGSDIRGQGATNSVLS